MLHLPIILIGNKQLHFQMFCSLKVILQLINKQVSYTQLAFEWLPIDNTGQDFTNPLNLYVMAEDECFLTKYYVPYPLTFSWIKYRIKSQNNVLMSLYLVTWFVVLHLLLILIYDKQFHFQMFCSLKVILQLDDKQVGWC